MADNISVTPGSGKTIAADEISSVLYQRVKLVTGADGANDGDFDLGATTKSGSVSVCLATDEDRANVVTTYTAHKAIETILADNYVYYEGQICLVRYAPITASSSGNTSIISAVASTKFGVLGIDLTVASAVNVKWTSNGSDITGLEYLQAGIVKPNSRMPYFVTGTANQALNINLSAAVAAGGMLRYFHFT